MTEALPIDPEVAQRLNSKKGKDLYGYQGEAIDQIMGRFRKFPTGYNLLYQLLNQMLQHYNKEHHKI